jgi:uncharacterized membrane protein
MNQELTVGDRKNGSKLGTSLTLMGMGLGLAELAAPVAVGRAVGLGDKGGITGVGMRLIGARGVALGLATLLRRKRSGWLWARVGGDLLDLAFLGLALGQSVRRGRRHRSLRLPLALGAVAGMTVVDVVRAVRTTRASREAARTASENIPGLAVTVDRTVADVYSFLRNPNNLTRFLSNVESVQVRGDGRAELAVKGPVGPRFRCRATILDSQPGESLNWIVTTEAGDPFCGGTMRLAKAPGDRGTEIHVALDGMMAAGGGGIGGSIVRLWTRESMRNDLRRLKQVLEVGEVTRSDASVHRGMHAARPGWRAESGASNGDPTLNPLGGKSS